MGAIAAQRTIHDFQAANQIEHLAPRKRSACRRAKMRSATERPPCVDQTAPLRIEQRTRAIPSLWQPDAARGSQRFRGHERFAPRQLRNAPSDLKLAASGPSLASAFDRTPREFVVHGSHFHEGSSCIGLGPIHSSSR
jgi:hypothetical protein